jgi:hypothetical protein
MTEPLNPTSASTPPPEYPQSGHWPTNGGNASYIVQAARRRQRAVVTVTLSLSDDVMLDRDVTLSLLYLVDGSTDYSRLFTRDEVARHSTVTLRQGRPTEITLTTLPLPPGSTFTLEAIAYSADFGTTISVPPVGDTSGLAAGAAEDKSLAALSALATTALVTALGALAFALLKRRD